jgi:hypothetical protein
VVIGANGLNTVGIDAQTLVKLLVNSTVSLNQATLPIIKKNPYGPASFCTPTGKSVTDNATTPGTLVRTLDVISFWSTGFYEWNDLRGSGYIIDGPNYFCAVLKEGVASNSKSMTVQWEEF